MLIQIQNSMGSKSKVKALLGKFESRLDEYIEEPQTPVQNVMKLHSDEEKLTVSERKQKFQKQISDTRLYEPKKTITAALSYQAESIKDKNQVSKQCKLRRNLPVTTRKPSFSPILVQRRVDKTVEMEENGTNSEKIVEKVKEIDEKMTKKPEIVGTTSVMSTNGSQHSTLIENGCKSSTFNKLTFQTAAQKPVLSTTRKTHILSVSTMVEALEEMAKSPLPPGAPPAKPPRTFAHDTYVAQKASKVKIQEHIYESVERVRNKCVNDGKPSVETENRQVLKNGNNSKQRLEPYAVSDIYKDGKGRKLSFPSVPKRRSHFFVDNVNITENNEGKLVRCFSDEHVYDEPYIEPGSLKSYNSDETLVLNNIIYDRINCETSKDDEGLHYSSTPILNLRRSVSSRTKSITNWPTFKKNPKNAIKKPKTAREIVSRSFSSVRRRPYSCDPGAARRSSSEDDSGDSDNELSRNELEKRIIYMRTVSRASSVKLDRRHLSDPAVPRLFDCVLIINLRDSESSVGYDPYVKLSYPMEYSGSDPVACPALRFCFPDSEFWKPSTTGESYTFVLTNQRGDRTYGYCRRIKPEDAPVSLPVVYCILSPVLSFRFYTRILYELECRHGSPDAEIKSFLDTLHHCRMPRPGHSIRMSISQTNSREEIQRPSDLISDDIGIEHLLKTLDISNLVKIFASLLLERRVVMYSSSLTHLSRCVHSFVAFLYPFVWQHTFIPVLPSVAIDIIGSPTPFLVGILSHFVSKLRDVPLDAGDPVLMVDLDHNRLFHETGDEDKVIPKKIQKGLTLALKVAKSGHETSVLATEAFIRLFVETVGHYDNFFVVQQDGKKVFERDSFLTAVDSHSITTFLQWFTETQMFNCFIDTLTEDNTVAYASFDKRIQEFREEINAPQTLGRNFKDLGKKVKTLGERLIGLKTIDKNKTNS
uniref:UDENN domain-containing protein n=1 Tax=Strigamia maritima TaxID=126957 RepID=T1IZY6_STRMM